MDVLLLELVEEAESGAPIKPDLAAKQTDTQNVTTVVLVYTRAGLYTIRCFCICFFDIDFKVIDVKEMPTHRHMLKPWLKVSDPKRGEEKCH